MGAELGREVHLVMKVLKEKISSDCFKFLSNVGKKTLSTESEDEVGSIGGLRREETV